RGRGGAAQPELLPECRRVVHGPLLDDLAVLDAKDHDLACRQTGRTAPAHPTDDPIAVRHELVHLELPPGGALLLDHCLEAVPTQRCAVVRDALGDEIVSQCEIARVIDLVHDDREKCLVLLGVLRRSYRGCAAQGRHGPDRQPDHCDPGPHLALSFRMDAARPRAGLVTYRRSLPTGRLHGKFWDPRGTPVTIA